MAEFTAVFVVEEDGSVDIKEECVEEKDPLSTTSQSTKGKKKHIGPILKWIENKKKYKILPCCRFHSSGS